MGLLWSRVRDSGQLYASSKSSASELLLQRPCPGYRPPGSREYYNTSASKWASASCPAGVWAAEVTWPPSPCFLSSGSPGCTPGLAACNARKGGYRRSLVRQEWPEKFFVLYFCVPCSELRNRGVWGPLRPVSSDAPAARAWHMKFSSHVPTAQRGKLRLSTVSAHTAGKGLLAGHSWPQAAILWSLALTAQVSEWALSYACHETKT